MSMNLTKEEAKRKFHTLDALRGFAAIAVVILHFKDYMRPLAFGNAQLAVDLFFLMSGVVIAHAYDDKIGQSIGVRNFFIARIVRLYPLYFLGLAIALVVPAASMLLGFKTEWTIESLAETTAFALFMLPSPHVEAMQNALYPLNFPAWSLFFEVIINIVYAICLVRISTRSLIILTLVFAAALVVGSYALGSIDGGPKWSDAWMGLLRVTFSFSAGLCISRLTIGRSFRLPAATGLCSVLLALILIFYRPGHHALEYQLSSVVILFPLVVATCVTAEDHKHSYWMTWLGLCSYPLYMIHVPAMPIIDRAFNRIAHSHPSQTSPWSGIVLIVMLLLVSWMIAKTYDHRARSMLKMIIGRMSRTSSPIPR